MNLDDRLGEYFSLREMVTSQTAARRGLKNVPNEAAIQSLRVLVAEVLDPIRRLAGGPIIVSSGYRSPEVNRALSGAANSQHCRGEACDFFSPRMSTDALFQLIRQSGIEVDQCINEFSQWVHCSFTKRHPNRNEYLIASKRNGSTIYRHLR